MKLIPNDYSLTLNTRFNNTYFISGHVYDKFALGVMGSDLNQNFGNNVMSNFADAITNVFFYPFDLKKMYNLIRDDEHTDISNYKEIYFGKRSIGLSGYWRNSRYVNETIGYLDMGTIYIKGKYNDFRDYEPYCQIKIYLPFIGEIELPPSLIVNKYVNFTYVINIFTGRVLVNIKTNKNNLQDNNWILIKIINSNIGVSLPIGGSNAAMLNTRMESSALAGILGTIAGAAAGFILGGAGGAAAGAITGLAGLAGGAIESGINADNPDFVSSGAIGNGGEMGYNGKNIIITYYYSSANIPTNYAKTYGFPAYYTERLTNLNGFTIVDNPHLEGSDFNLCLDDEKKELEKILTSGFLLDDKT